MKDAFLTSRDLCKLDSLDRELLSGDSALLLKIEAEKASLLKEKAGVCPLVSASSKASK